MKCSAKTKSGKRCRALATASGLCSLHANPGRAAELGRMGRNKPKTPVDADEQIQIPQSVDQVKGALAIAMAQVYKGQLDPKLGTAVGYLASVLLRAIEAVDLEKRIAALEEGANGAKPAR